MWSADLDQRWLAIQVRPRTEERVACYLQQKGYEMFVPVATSRRRRGKPQERAALFPGYIFCRFDRHNGSPIITTAGVVRIVGSAVGPHPLEDSEIAALQRIAGSQAEAQPWPYVSEGQRVIIEEGALAGIQGLVLRVARGCRLAISVELLRRSIAVEVDRAWIRVLHAAGFAGAFTPCI